ncbi:TetR/AcrR family transcriptional regulator [Rhodococcus triatomae]|uniref:DNA-binding transcriptional regulator, AcrR family n=1 Tax=Rhodococcus triatomae TaxID=300028 RepID=A0A1G8MUA6_9NOCA|nr:TetR/AcrR family transcriptional regulator [Rhodococcus triatomae]QNG19092.1 TetR/AcrR family transcriptional regulator [Rhodococcus triatomae]QNG24995.1 TetR/AcrR family transcriptional regulator [Rhodococcus triatomae]SDI71385.1 DNA-binding transcriptional regulator, AcrR family [Rhodococcus triatomae]
MVDDVRVLLEQSRDSLRVVRSFEGEERARRADIAEAARRLASAEGYQGLTIRAVAAAAGTTPVTIYRYFGSKDGLAQHLMAEWALETIGRLRALELDAELSAAERISAAFATLVEWAAQDLHLLDAGMSSIHGNTAGMGIGLWRPLFVELVRSALADPDWEDDEQRALVLGHVLTTCLLDLTSGSGDVAQIRDTISVAARLLFADVP